MWWHDLLARIWVYILVNILQFAYIQKKPFTIIPFGQQTRILCQTEWKWKEDLFFLLVACCVLPSHTLHRIANLVKKTSYSCWCRLSVYCVYVCVYAWILHGYSFVFKCQFVYHKTRRLIYTFTLFFIYLLLIFFIMMYVLRYVYMYVCMYRKSFKSLFVCGMLWYAVYSSKSVMRKCRTNVMYSRKSFDIVLYISIYRKWFL